MLVRSVTSEGLGQITGMLIQDDNIYVTTAEQTFNSILPSGKNLHLAGALDTSKGFENGQGTLAKFHRPRGIAPFPGMQGTFLIADSGNNAIRMVSNTNMVTTFVGEKQGGWLDGKDGMFRRPTDIIVLPDGNFVVCDTANHALRTVTPHKLIATLAGNYHESYDTFTSFGDGTGDDVYFFHPQSLTLDRLGNVLVADFYNDSIRHVKITGKVSQFGHVTTVAGSSTDEGHIDGPGSTAIFSRPASLVIDEQDRIFVADENNNCIRMIVKNPDNPETTIVTTLACTDPETNGPISFNTPCLLALDSNGLLYVVEHRSPHSFRVFCV
jgi:hypothetical protein